MPNGQTGMGQQLALWFLYSALVAFFSGYVTSKVLPAWRPTRGSCSSSSRSSRSAYSIGLWQMAIWYRRSWVVTIKSTIDGLLYGLLTAAAFMWLWPR